MDTLQQIEIRLASIENKLAGSKDVLAFDEVADLTGLSKSTLYKMISARQIPHYKPNGRVIYFKREEIVAWMQQGKVDIINRYSWFWNEKFQIVLHLAIDVISMFLTTVV